MIIAVSGFLGMGKGRADPLPAQFAPAKNNNGIWF
jgi:hypothetical protein